MRKVRTWREEGTGNDRRLLERREKPRKRKIWYQKSCKGANIKGKEG